MKMKKITITLLLLLSATIVLAQKKEKTNGSKTVTTEQKEISNFSALEIEDNLEVYLERGEKPEIKIEADDNLHDIIAVELEDKTLRLYTSKKAIKYKKLIVRITYTKDLKLITSKNETNIYAIEQIQLENMTIKTLGDSKFFINANTKNFLLQSEDNSKVELNLKSEKAKIQLSKNSSLKSLITAAELACDLYQKANANIEGDVTNAAFRLDNNSNLTANKLTAKNIDLTSESYSNCSLNAETNIIIDAHENSEIQLFGNPKIEIRQFTDEAKLLKKVI
jgi:hypothetical protein